MNYTDLKADIQDICENTFTDAQLALFTDQAEQKIYNSVQIPALRRNVTGSMTSGNRFLAVPSDFLYTYSLAAISSAGVHTFLLNKDVNFMREAFPNPATTGTPTHYAYFSDTSFLVGPTPSSALDTELHYGYYPESIVTAGTTWLGDEFDSALLNGALIEAIRFMKGEPETISNYQGFYVHALGLLKNLGDGKLREDAYRSGQYRQAVG
jgi:hypothetical protein